MISVNFSPSICSSKTHISTLLTNKFGLKAQFSATTLAIVVPQLPEPITVTLNGLSAFGSTDLERMDEVCFNLSEAGLILEIFLLVLIVTLLV